MMKSQRVSNERSDLRDLIATAIKATYSTRSFGGVERCIDVLHLLKSLSLSAKDIQSSESIIELETLRNHRNPNIRKETQALFHSWLKTIYGIDSSLNLKRKRVTSHDSTTDFEIAGNKQIEPGKDSTNPKSVNALENNQREVMDFLEAANKNIDLKRRRVSSQDATVKKTELKLAGNKLTEAVRDSTNPKSADAVNNKQREIVDLFEAAKKAADMANAKGILCGKPEASRCVAALSLLMKTRIAPKSTDAKQMIERLERLTKHKDRTICHAASALLKFWTKR